MKVGDKIVAKWTEKFTDNVTKGVEYPVVEVNDVGFYIINDKNEKCLPVSVEFRKL